MRWWETYHLNDTFPLPFPGKCEGGGPGGNILTRAETLIMLSYDTYGGEGKGGEGMYHLNGTFLVTSRMKPIDISIGMHQPQKIPLQ